MIRYFLLIGMILSLSTCSGPEKETNNIGVLVLAHGSMDKSWNKAVEQAVSPTKDKYEVEIAWGMANAMRMQPAIDALQSKGVTDIIVVQLFVSSFSPIIRQNEYLLGIRDSLADAPMAMMIHDMETKTMTMEIPENLQPLEIDANIILTDPLDNHPLVAEILHERILELSTNPSEETVLLVAHGPNAEDDNDNWVAALSDLGQQIAKMQESEGQAFAKFEALTVRDDADEETHEKARIEFRNKVKAADDNGSAIVIPVLLASGGVEKKYVKRLEGLNYLWSGKALLPHENITEFVTQRVEEGLGRL